MTNEPGNKDSTEKPEVKSEDEMVTIPKRQMQEYVKQVNDDANRRVEDHIAVLNSKYEATLAGLEERENARQASLDKTLAEIEGFKARPWKDYMKELGAEIMTAVVEKAGSREVQEVVNAQVRPIIERDAPAIVKSEVQTEVSNILPGAVKAQIKAEEPTLKKIMDGSLKSMTTHYVEQARPEIKAAVEEENIRVQNLIDGAKDTTIEQTVARKQKRSASNRRRNKLIGAGVLAAAGFLTGAIGYVYYMANQATTEGAAGVANSALSLSTATNNALTEHERGNVAWQSDWSRSREEDNAAARVGMRDLEERLFAEITRNRTEFEARLADSKKDYVATNAKLANLETAFNGETINNVARENAYNGYREVVANMKKEVGELKPLIEGLRNAVYSKQQVDEIVGGLREIVEGYGRGVDAAAKTGAINSGEISAVKTEIADLKRIIESYAPQTAP